MKDTSPERRGRLMETMKIGPVGAKGANMG